MPFRWIVDAVRDTFAGDFGASSVMLWGTGWAWSCSRWRIWWGTAVFRKENA